jgi:hypothetical protein
MVVAVECCQCNGNGDVEVVAGQSRIDDRVAVVLETEWLRTARSRVPAVEVDDEYSK